jgi:hypothetical protein
LLFLDIKCLLLTLVALGFVFAGTVITTNNSSFLAFEFLLRNRHVLIFGVLKAADKIRAFNHDVTDWAIVLIAHTRAGFFMQQVERYVLAFSRGMDADGDRHYD